MKKIPAGLALLTAVLSLVFLSAACNRGVTVPPSAPSGGNPNGSTPTGTTTNTPTSTTTSTPTVTGTPPTATPTPNCNAYQVINLVGNLNTGLQVNQPGGVVIICEGSQWNLPFGTGELNGYDLNKLTYLPNPNMPAIYFLQQVNLTVPLDSASIALPNHTMVIASGQPAPLPVPYPNPNGLEFAWDQPSVYPAACTVVKSFTDSSGSSRQVTFLFYQVNDLGVLGLNSPPNNQAVYAWYAFDTSFANPTCDQTLIGGTFILELSPFENPGSNTCDDRGVTGDVYWGDFLYFNSDGSLASEGAVRSSGGIKVQTKPHLLESIVGAADSFTPLVPPYLCVNFGTAGMLGYGLRDGVTGDAAPCSVH